MSPDLLTPPAIVPTGTAMTAALTGAGLPTLCGCVAKKNFRIFVTGDAATVESQMDAINDAITSEWQSHNTGMGYRYSCVCILIMLKYKTAFIRRLFEVS